METLLVLAIVMAAAAFVARTFYLKFKTGASREDAGGCRGCGCSGTCDKKNPGPP